MRTNIEIAFRRKVRAVWLDQGMALAAQDLPWQDAKPALAEAVAAENPGAETIRKVLEHVRRIWFEPPDNCIALRSAALSLFRASGSPATRTLLNWGMAIAAYPFVGSVGEALGRLLKLQHEAHRADIQRRLREQHGDRDFVSRITRYDVSSFLDWGVIAETKRAGVYLPGKQVQPRKAEQLAWLADGGDARRAAAGGPDRVGRARRSGSVAGGPRIRLRPCPPMLRASSRALPRGQVPA